MATREQNYENQRAFKERMEAQGFTQVAHWIPADKKELCKAIARALREGYDFDDLEQELRTHEVNR
jgi:hypothetical protein